MSPRALAIFWSVLIAWVGTSVNAQFVGNVIANGEFDRDLASWVGAEPPPGYEGDRASLEPFDALWQPDDGLGRQGSGSMLLTLRRPSPFLMDNGYRYLPFAHAARERYSFGMQVRCSRSHVSFGTRGSIEDQTEQVDRRGTVHPRADVRNIGATVPADRRPHCTGDWEWVGTDFESDPVNAEAERTLSLHIAMYAYNAPLSLDSVFLIKSPFQVYESCCRSDAYPLFKARRFEPLNYGPNDIRRIGFFRVEGGTGPYTARLVGSPEWLTVEPSVSDQVPPYPDVFVITANPASMGLWRFLIEITDSVGKKDYRIWEWDEGDQNGSVPTQPVAIAGPSSYTVRAQDSFSLRLAATGGWAPHEWSLLSSPSWLTLSRGGLLVGIPPAAGTVAVGIRVTDQKGVSAERTIGLDVRPAVQIVIRGVAPKYARPGDLITISGSGFSTADSGKDLQISEGPAVEVLVGGTAASDVRVVDDETITAIVPQLNLGPADITIRVHGESVTLPSSETGFKIGDPPRRRVVRR